MDNKDLTLEEILAGKDRSDNSNTDELSEEISEDIEDSDGEVSARRKLSVDEILAQDSEDSSSPGKRSGGLTVDEILAGDSDHDTEKADGSVGGLTVDEILADSDDDKSESAASDSEAEYDDESFENERYDDDQNDDEQYSDDDYDEQEYDDDIDSAPTMIMPRSRQRSSRYEMPVRRRRRKKRSAKKGNSFNGSIFGGIILTCIILTVSIVLAITGISVATEYYGIGKSDNDVIFNIPKGSTNENIADLLYENGIINNKTLFLLALKIEKPETIYPGDITLQASMGYSDVIEKLATLRDPLKTVNVTITEGMNLLDVANLLEKNGVCKADEFLFEFNKNQGFDFEKDLGVSKDAFYKMEGYFFPETYNFYVNDTPYNVTKIVREQFQRVLNADLMRQVKSSKFSLNQIMILASIVQLEAGKESEMPMVASVFVNRMNDPATYKNLQSDTSSRYIEKVIQKKASDQTSIDFYTSVYDTYTCEGLPASPICNPGLAAIKAVLNPAKSDYYFFCNNLSTGETFFARTYEEHQANLKKAGLA